MAFNGANFTLTGDIGWSCSCLDPGRAVTGSWCGMARWALGRVVAAAEPPGAGAGARSQLHRCYGNLGAIPGESQKSTAKLTSSWQAAPRAVGPRLAEGCLIYGKYSRGFQELSRCTRWRGSWWHGGIPMQGCTDTEGSTSPGTEGLCHPTWRRDSGCLWLLVSPSPSPQPLSGLRWGKRSGGKPGKKCQGRQGRDSSMPSNAAVKQRALGNSACWIVAQDYLGAPLCCSCTKASHLAKISSVSRHCS